tara:strand:+ start:210 stop:716 length:507 start_codon:yes stop_codon:yes gene_type:complete
MLISIFGYLFLFVGFLILALPLVLVELSRPRDWLMGGLFLFLGLFLFVENDLLRSSINLFVISIAILYGKMISEIFQNRWYQLSPKEKKRIGTFERWFESFTQLGKSFSLFGNHLISLFKGLSTKSEKSSKEKKWVHPELQEEIKKKEVDLSGSADSNKIRNQELTEK